MSGCLYVPVAVQQKNLVAADFTWHLAIFHSLLKGLFLSLNQFYLPFKYPVIKLIIMPSQNISVGRASAQ